MFELAETGDGNRAVLGGKLADVAGQSVQRQGRVFRGNAELVGDLVDEGGSHSGSGGRLNDWLKAKGNDVPWRAHFSGTVGTRNDLARLVPNVERAQTRHSHGFAGHQLLANSVRKRRDYLFVGDLFHA